MRWVILALVLSLLGPPVFAQQRAASADLTRLHDALHLTQAQQARWEAYARAIAPNPEAEARHRATEGLLPSLPTPRRIALIEATMAADQADFRKQGAAVTAFYSQLTPSQQQTFDAETVPPANTASR